MTAGPFSAQILHGKLPAGCGDILAGAAPDDDRQMCAAEFFDKLMHPGGGAERSTEPFRTGEIDRMIRDHVDLARHGARERDQLPYLMRRVVDPVEEDVFVCHADLGPRVIVLQ